MEKDDEVSGNGNSYTTEFRQYDPRLGRWKSLDPLMYMFPGMSPYCAFDNNPIFYIDPYGLKGVKPKDNTPGAFEGGKAGDKGKPKLIDVIKTDEITNIDDRRAQPGQTITLPRDVQTGYSPDGRILQDFTYSFEAYDNANNIYIETRTFKGSYDSKSNSMVYKTDDGLSYVSSKFFKNEAEAYTYMWNNTQDEKGNINTEQIAYITENGVWVSTNAFSSSGSSRNTIKTVTKNNVLYVNGERVLAQLHTHPNINPAMNGANEGLSPADVRSSKHLLGALQISMGYFSLIDGIAWPTGAKGPHFVKFPKNVTRQSLMDGSVKLIPILKANL